MAEHVTTNYEKKNYKVKEKSLSLKFRQKRELIIGSTVFLLPVTLILVVYIFYHIIDTFLKSYYDWNVISIDR